MIIKLEYLHRRISTLKEFVEHRHILQRPNGRLHALHQTDKPLSLSAPHMHVTPREVNR